MGTAGRTFEIHRKFLSVVASLLLICYCGNRGARASALLYFRSSPEVEVSELRRLPAVTNQRENFSGCQMSFKCAVLEFCPPSCQLARSMSLFFFPSSSIFPADLAEVHGERKKGTDERERERTSKHLLGQKKKQHRNRLASNVSQSGWLARCQALLICFTKHLNGPDNCD